MNSSSTLFALIALFAFIGVTNSFQIYSPFHHITPTHKLQSSSSLSLKSERYHSRTTQLAVIGGTVDDKITITFRLLACVSFVTSLLGLSFQIFVLYPWHEELSYEFKTLERAIIRLDRTLEVTNPTMTEEQLKRLTDKYTLKPNADKAGPKISDYIKVLSDEDAKLIRGSKR